MSRESSGIMWPVWGCTGWRIHDGTHCDRQRDGKECDHPSVHYWDRDRYLSELTKKSAFLSRFAFNWTKLILTGKRLSGPDSSAAPESSFINLDLITSDQYAQAYLDHLFSDKGPVAKLENYFIMAGENLATLRTECKDKTEVRNGTEEIDGGLRVDTAKDDKHVKTERREGREEAEERERRDERLKLSIVETQPDESLDQNLNSAANTRQPWPDSSKLQMSVGNWR